MDTNRLARLSAKLEIIKSETGYPNMKMDTLVTREQLNPFNLSHSFAIDREADLIVCPGCIRLKTNYGISPEEIHRQSSRTQIPFLIY